MREGIINPGTFLSILHRLYNNRNVTHYENGFIWFALAFDISSWVLTTYCPVADGEEQRLTHPNTFSHFTPWRALKLFKCFPPIALHPGQTIANTRTQLSDSHVSKILLPHSVANIWVADSSFELKKVHIGKVYTDCYSMGGSVKCKAGWYDLDWMENGLVLQDTKFKPVQMN